MGIKKNNSKYTSAVRIKNKTRKLEKKIRHLEKCREKPLEAKPGRPLAIRKSIEHIRRDCRIGRKAEGFQMEVFKQSKKMIKKEVFRGKKGKKI